MSVRRFLPCLFMGMATSSLAQDLPDLEDLLAPPLSELMEMDVSLASGVDEPLIDAPAAMVVISAQDIQQRGYTGLHEVLLDLPGFDVTVTNGTLYLTAYQRGYRTPQTQRTLLMIDGRVDNHLWSHAAQISRQYPLTNVERVEVLYGPASAVYGPNAFQGIINIQTKSGAGLEPGETVTRLDVQAGSFATGSVDATTQGRMGDVTYSATARVFRSDEADLSDRGGFTSSAMLSNPALWGPLLDLENDGHSLGEYHDPTDDLALQASIGFGDLSVGGSHWRTREGYGAYYPADRAQNNAFWVNTSDQWFARYEAPLTEQIRGQTSIVYRRNTIGGEWAEASPDGQDASWVSLSSWNSASDSWALRQQVEIDVDENLQLLTGMKFERKDLTKAYDIPGYWDAYSSVSLADDGPHGAGAGIGHSTDETYRLPPAPAATMPALNRTLTDDLGGFLQATASSGPYRLNAGLRYDHNSVYGGTVNPRLSAIYRFAERGSIKALYGEAFQEPAPIQLWGGWQGRLANPDLDPEKVRTVELIAMYQTGRVLFDASVYRATYDNVLKEEAENAGERTIVGLELRPRFTLANPIADSPDITGHFYYTLTQARSSIRYDPELADWIDSETDLGDIAPSKIRAGLVVPIRDRGSVYLGSRYESAKKLYLRNPLRWQGEELDGWMVIDAAVNLHLDLATLRLRVNNLLDNDYFHSGVEAASSGNDVTQRSLGWMNSLVPQAGRNVQLTLSYNY